MDSPDTRADCDCRGCRLSGAAGTAVANARAADGDGDAAAPGAAYAIPADGDGCPGYGDADDDGYSTIHATADLDAATHCDGHSNGRGFTWYRAGGSWRYVMEYRLQVV